MLCCLQRVTTSRRSRREGYPSGSRTTAVCCYRWERRPSQLYHICTQQRKTDRAPVLRQQYFARPFMHAALMVKARRSKEYSQIMAGLSSTIVMLTAEPFPSFPQSSPFPRIRVCVYLCVWYCDVWAPAAASNFFSKLKLYCAWYKFVRVRVNFCTFFLIRIRNPQTSLLFPL